MNVRVFARNIFSNWFGFAANVCIMLLLTPYVLGALGEARYGVWVLVMSISGYCGLLDLGIRSGTTQYLTQALSTKDYDRANAVINSSLAPLGAVGVLIAVLCPIVGAMLALVFQLPPGMDRELFWCLTLLGVSVAVEISLNPFHAVFIAKQRFDLSNIIGVTNKLSLALAVWFCLSAGYGLVGLATVTTIVNSLGSIVRALVAKRLLPQLTVSLGLANWSDVRSVFNFGIWSFLLSINLAIALYTDALLIGIYLPVAAITLYALAGNLGRYLGQDLLGSARQVFYPAAVDLHTRQMTTELRSLYLSGSRTLLVVAVGVAIVSGVWVDDFFQLWVGHELDRADVKTIAFLFRILCTAIVFEFSSTLASQLLVASGRIRVVAILSISQGALNLVLTVVLLPFLGLVGAAIGTLVSVVLLRTVLPVWLAKREAGVGIRSFYASVLPRPAILGICCGGLAILLREWHPPETWLHLAWHGLLAAGMLAAAFFAVGVSSSERELLLQQFFRRKSAPAATEATVSTPVQSR